VTVDTFGSAFLFLAVVGVVIAVGVVVGMIAAGRIDKLMTPAPKPPVDEPTPGTERPSTEEDQP
jgi:hypothetical protein